MTVLKAESGSRDGRRWTMQSSKRPNHRQGGTGVPPVGRRRWRSTGQTPAWPIRHYAFSMVMYSAIEFRSASSSGVQGMVQVLPVMTLAIVARFSRSYHMRPPRI